MSDLENLVQDITTSVDLAGIDYHDDHVEIRFRLTFASRTVVELPIRIPYSTFADSIVPLPAGSRPPVNVVTLKASQWLPSIAQTFDHKVVQICEELGEGGWPFPMT